MATKQEIKELFSFNKRERNGIFLILIFLIITITANNTVGLLQDNTPEDVSAFQKEIDAFEASLVPKEEETYLSRLDKFIIARYDTLHLFKFDPNKITEEDWRKLGFTQKQGKTIRNYLNKGGHFFEKSDFRKVYGIRTKQFEILEPYLIFPEKGKNSSSKINKFQDLKKEIPHIDSLFIFDPNNTTIAQWKSLGFTNKQGTMIANYLSKGGKFYKKEDLKSIYTVTENQYLAVEKYIKIPEKVKNNNTYVDNSEVIVDLNNFTEEQFKNIGGFWKYNARNIISFRKKLGGFINKEQLLDIWSVKKKYYDKIRQKVIPGNVSIKKVRINFANTKKLVSHPYITYPQAIQIIEYREKHGFINNLSDLRTHKVMSQTTFDKISPYLTTK